MSEQEVGFVERVRSIQNFHKNAAIYLGLAALGRIRKIDGSRGLLDEPYDFFNHNGNILSSVTTAIVVAATVRLRSEATPRRSTIMGAALASGALVNALVETRTGLGLPIVPPLFRDSTPDSIDLVYGMVGAAAGGVMVLSMQEKKILSTDGTEYTDKSK